jgi:hypothetical protein
MNAPPDNSFNRPTLACLSSSLSRSEVAPLGICERSHGPVIDDQDRDAAEPRQQAA